MQRSKRSSKYFHRVVLTVFASEEDELSAVEESLRALFPFSLEEAKILVERKKATGFEEKTIVIFRVVLEKSSQVSAFASHVLGLLSSTERILLRDQLESRLDEHLHFFVRIDKNLWMRSRNVRLVDHGLCFHLNFSVAAFPKKRPIGLAVLQEWLESIER